MSRRYRYDAELGRCVEVGAEWTDAEKRAPVPTEALVYGHLGTATDGTPIDSRTKHARYMKENNLAMADDYKGVWAKAKAEREAFYTGQGTPESRREVREDVGRALYEARKRNR